MAEGGIIVLAAVTIVSVILGLMLLWMMSPDDE
jgi:hypothetical protein